MMEEIKELFTFIDQVVWQVRRGHGSFLTMEFGTPHLAVREPIVASPDRSDRVKRNLSRRHIVVTGDWHFWIQYGEWRISTSYGVLSSGDPSGSDLDECLADLDRQKVCLVEPGSRRGSCSFGFDLGGELEIWPSKDVPDDQWSLHSWDGDIVTCRNDGNLVSEKADFRQRVYTSLDVEWSAAR